MSDCYLNPEGLDIGKHTSLSMPICPGSALMTNNPFVVNPIMLNCTILTSLHPCYKTSVLSCYSGCDFMQKINRRVIVPRTSAGNSHGLARACGQTTRKVSSRQHPLREL